MLQDGVEVTLKWAFEKRMMELQVAQTSYHEMQTVLSSIKEAQINGVLKNALSGLQRSCTEYDSQEEAKNIFREEAITHNVQYFICALERVASLAQCSDFVLPGAFCVLHEGLNVLSHIADCILSRHLNLLLKSPSATDLIMHFISAHPKHMARLYGRMYELLIQGEIKEDLLRQSTCSRHMLRDIRALLPTSEDVSSLRTKKPLQIQLASYFPHLLGIALKIGLKAEQEDGQAETQGSNVSQSTQEKIGGNGGALELSYNHANSLQAEDLPAFSVQIASLILQNLSDSTSLMTHLGLQAKSTEMQAEGTSQTSRNPLLAHLSQSMYQEEDANSESKKEDACRVYLQFIDILIEAFASQPKVADQILGLMNGELCCKNTTVDFQSNVGSHTSILTCINTQTELTQSSKTEKDKKNSVPLHTREDMAIDLLCLHTSLSKFEGQVSEGDKTNPSLLSIPSLLWLANLSLRQMQNNSSNIENIKRRTSRRVSGMPQDKGMSMCVPPDVVSHLLQTIRAFLKNSRGKITVQDNMSSSDRLTELGKLGANFSSIAMQGPQANCDYSTKSESALGLDFHLQHKGKNKDRHKKSEAETRTSNSCETEEPSAKRQKTFHNVSIDGLKTFQKGAILENPQSVPSNCKQKEKSELEKTKGFLPAQKQLPRLNSAQTPTHVSNGTEKPVHPSSQRRIAPIQIPNSSKEVESKAIIDSLLRQKEEDEAYWEQYIQVKQEFVESVLQDDLEEETEHFNGGGSKSKNTMKQMLTGVQGKGKCSVSKPTYSSAFRKLEWQHLQAASLYLQAESILKLKEGNSSEIWKVFQGEGELSNAQHIIMMACKLVDPSFGRNLFNSALQGAKLWPNECKVLAIVMRMTQYCQGFGERPHSELFEGFAEIICQLVGVLTSTLPINNEPENQKALRPLDLIGDALLAILDCGILDLGGLKIDNKLQFSQAVLHSHTSDTQLFLVSLALWTFLQAQSEGVNDMEEVPRRVRSQAKGWCDLWASLNDKSDIKIASVKLLKVILSNLKSLWSQIKDNGDSDEALDSDRLETLAILCGALKSQCLLIAQKGKEVICGSGLKCLLLTLDLVFNFSQQALKDLNQALSGSEQNDRLWYSALFIGGIQHLQDPGLSLLKWRLKTCPKAAKDAAFALENSSLKFAKELDSLHSNLMASKGIHPEILEEIQDGLECNLSGISKHQIEGEQLIGSLTEVDRHKPQVQRKKKLWRPANAYLKAVLEEEQCRVGTDSEDDFSNYSDLEDFIVCKPDRDYDTFIANEFRYCDDD